MKVLLSYTSNPMTTASYLEKAMRKICSVITYGPAINKKILKNWNLLAIEERVKEHQIPLTDGDMSGVLNRLPSDWYPDVFLFMDSGISFPLKNMNSLKCIKACYMIDSHIHFEAHLDFARGFDIVFTAHKPAVDKFKERGLENVYWMPPGCDQDIHGRKTEKELYDIGFVGTLNPALNAERVHLFEELQKRFNTYYERCFFERMAEVFSGSKIVFHKSALDGLAMRVFEVMAAGSMLLADEATGSGFTDLFHDREHIVIYRSKEELIELSDYYLRNEDERRKIAADGMEKVLNEHTYSHRAESMVRTLSVFKKLGAFAS